MTESQEKELSKRIALEWDKIESVESVGEEESILTLTGGKKVRVKHSIEEVITRKEWSVMEDFGLFDFVRWEEDKENVQGV